MHFQYDIAFSIFFRHEFFADGKLRSFVVKPTAETQITLKRLGGMVKAFQNGIHVLYESSSSGQERSRADFLATEESLEFIVDNLDAAFFNYTAAFSIDLSESYFFFNNSGSPPSREKKVLHQGAFVGQADIRKVDTNNTNFFAKPFGLIHIQLHPNVAPAFDISFSSASTYWCYVLTPDYLQELVNPAIIHKDTKEPFLGPQAARLPDNTTAIAFFSAVPIPHRERSPTTFQLVEDYDPETFTFKVVIPALPSPDPHYISSFPLIAEQKEKRFSCIFL